MSARRVVLWPCSRCGESKPRAAFRLDRKGYVRSHCIACSRLDNQDSRDRNRDALATRRRERYAAARAAGMTVLEAERAKDRRPFAQGAR